MFLNWINLKISKSIINIRFVEKETNISPSKLKGLELYGVNYNETLQNEEIYNSNDKIRSSKRSNLNKKQLNLSLSPLNYIIGPDYIDVSEKIYEKRKETDLINFSLSPQCKIPMKNMGLKMALKSDNKVDIRNYDIEFTVNPVVIKFFLEMKTNAKKEINQTLPIPNSNNFEVTIKPSFDVLEGNSSYFKFNSKNFKIKKKSIENFHINFKPMWMCKCKANLTFFNLNTHEKTVYEITAISEKPLNEETICVKTNINHEETISIPLKNYSNNLVEYKIETDIPNAVHDKKINIKQNHQIDFKIKFNLAKSGEFNYKVKFINKEEYYIWYLIKITAEGNNIVELKDPIKSFVR